MLTKNCKAKVLSGWRAASKIVTYVPDYESPNLTLLEPEKIEDEYYLPAKSLKLNREEIFELYDFITQMLQEDQVLMSKFKEHRSKNKE